MINLKGLSRYTFDMNDGRIIVRNLDGRILHGTVWPDQRTVYTLLCDDKKKRRYKEGTLAFYFNNPQLPALCNNFNVTGVHLSQSGEVITDFHPARKYDVFGSIDDALETLLLVKSYKQGDKYPMFLWMKQARDNALYTVTKFRHYGFERAKACLDGADMRFLSQLETFNIRRIMPLFAMYCKCLKQELMCNALISFDEKKYKKI